MREIPQKTVAKVLWDAGFKSPGSMKRRGNIPQRSAERYIQCFKEGGDHNRKNYSSRRTSTESQKVKRKVIEKASNRGKIQTARNEDLPKTPNALKKSIKKHWNAIDIEFLMSFLDSMPNRMEMLIENEGSKINY